MSDSIRLGQVRGITIRLHYSVLLILGLLILLPGPTTTQWALGYIFLLGPVVLMHELGHSIVAQHFGIRVVDISFWPLGGMARMSQIPEDSRIEGWIAIAGPLVNFALALLAAPLMLLAGLGGQIALGFVGVNLILGVFNLLPAFPMDGGRVLRAWLGRGGDWLAATERAVRIGRFVAGGMLLIGIFTMNPVLPLIGIFVWWAGGQELYAVRVRHHGPPALSFGPFRIFWPQDAANGTGAAPRPAQSVRREGARDPETPPPPTNGDPAPARRPVEPAAGDKRGWSEEDLERLERFPGRLRQFPSDE